LQLREWEAGRDLISAYDLIKDLLANCGREQPGAETVATVAARVRNVTGLPNAVL
jgi:hypothetical protein